jgi:hypothetical protein
MDMLLIVVALVAFNAGFLFGAFWVSAKNNDAKDMARQRPVGWARVPLR